MPSFACVNQHRPKKTATKTGALHNVGNASCLTTNFQRCAFWCMSGRSGVLFKHVPKMAASYQSPEVLCFQNAKCGDGNPSLH